MRYWMVILLAALFFSGISQGQNASLPLVLEIDGDIWTWKAGDAALTRLTEWGYNYALQSSPDGTQVAFLSLPQLSVDVVRQYPTTEYYYIPVNIWILDLLSGRISQVAKQPESATPENRNRIWRSEPAWSADGRRLAWVESGVESGIEFGLNLRVFDTHTKTTQILAENIATLDVPPGLWRVWYLNDTLTVSSEDAIAHDPYTLVYDMGGQLLNEWQFSSRAEDFDYYMWVLLSYRGADYMALQPEWNNPTWKLVNLVSREEFQLSPLAPVMVAQMNPAKSLRLQPGWLSGSSLYEVGAVLDTDSHPIPLTSEPLWQATLSPDGRSVAAVLRHNNYPDRVIVWRDGEILTVPMPDEAHVRQIAWGAMVWEIRP